MSVAPTNNTTTTPESNPALTIATKHHTAPPMASKFNQNAIPGASITLMGNMPSHTPVGLGNRPLNAQSYPLTWGTFYPFLRGDPRN